MESFCVRSIRGFAKFSRDPYYEPTTVVHDMVVELYILHHIPYLLHHITTKVTTTAMSACITQLYLKGKS